MVTDNRHWSDDAHKTFKFDSLRFSFRILFLCPFDLLERASDKRTPLNFCFLFIVYSFLFYDISDRERACDQCSCVRVDFIIIFVCYVRVLLLFFFLAFSVSFCSFLSLLVAKNYEFFQTFLFSFELQLKMKIDTGISPLGFLFVFRCQYRNER